MRATLLIHVLAGGLGLLSGYLALAVSKGAPLHRKSGMFFVWTMLVLAVTGMLVAAINGVAPEINVPTALLTAYLVITSLTTVRPFESRSAGVASMVVAFAIGAGCFAFAVRALAQGGPTALGFGIPLVLFGGVAVAAGVGDRRLLKSGALAGGPRLKRHLWRMCCALFVASIAFYLGRDRLPEALRSPAFRATGLLLPIGVMSYWLWRLRARRSVRTMARVTLSEAAS